MEKLQEIFQTNISLLTEKSKLPSWAIGQITYDFAKGGKQNLNGRIYPSELLAREVKRKAEQLRGQKIAGQLDHPDNAGIHTKLDKAMHVLDSVFYDSNTGLASAKSYILDTNGGRNFLTLLKSGLKLGASMRGLGSVQNKIVQNDWEFDTVDFVLKPSFGDTATISSQNLVESANHLLEKTEKKEEKPKGSSEKFIQRIMESVWRSQCDFFGFNDSFEDWKRKNEAHMRAIIAVEDGLYSSEQEALEAMGHHEEARKLLNVQQRVTVQDVAFEAMVAGVDPAEYAKKINASIDEEEARENLSFSLEERQRIFAECRRAGMDMGDPAERKKALEIYGKKLLDEDEKLEAGAKQFLEAYKAENPNSNVTLESVKKMLLKEREEKQKEEIEKMKIQTRIRENLIAGPPKKFD